MTRLTDYGIILLACVARASGQEVHNARDLATASRLPLPTVNKVLKTLTRKGLLASQRGVKGGYRLARRPEDVTLAQIIGALEGPVTIADCTGEVAGSCEHEGACPVQGNWQRINQAIRDALDRISLSEMARPLAGPSGLLRLRPPASASEVR